MNEKVDRKEIDGEKNNLEIKRKVGSGKEVCEVKRKDEEEKESGDEVRERGIKMMRRDIVKMGINEERGEDKVIERYGVGWREGKKEESKKVIGGRVEWF